METIFDNERQLLKDGFKIIGRDLFAKGKMIKGRCDHCNIIDNISFNLLNRQEKKLRWSCNICKTDTSTFSNERLIIEERW